MSLKDLPKIWDLIIIGGGMVYTFYRAKGLPRVPMRSESGSRREVRKLGPPISQSKARRNHHSGL